jgi:hypothetical protein
LKGKLPANPKFNGGEKLIGFQISLFSKVDETHIPLE